MDLSNTYKELGKILVKKLRDENYDSYLQLKYNANSKTKQEYYNESRNPKLDKEFQKLADERFELFNSLSSEHQKPLDKLILNILDSTAFNLLREVEENLQKNTSIGLTINGKPIETIQTELLSGTLFGEYFLWAENNSNYGKFQQ